MRGSRETPGRRERASSLSPCSLSRSGISNQKPFRMFPRVPEAAGGGRKSGSYVIAELHLSSLTHTHTDTESS